MKSLLLLLAMVLPMALRASTVRMERVPEGGVQPQVVAGADGTLHMVYLTGEPGKADVNYASRKPGTKAWSKAVLANSQPGTAVALGTIRGAQVAVAADGRVHVVWNGPGSKDRPSELFYARKEPAASAFEPQRSLLGDTKALDGGATIAAGNKGQVFIVWHGAPAGAQPGEQNRVVFVLKSTDSGRTFAGPKAANLDDAGVCACCSVKSFVSPEGDLFTLYRAARRPDQRDVTLLISKDGGASFQHQIVGPWAIAACPMSSMSIVGHGKAIRGAWEVDGKIFSSILNGREDAVAVAEGGARHPSLAVNRKGETLVSWSVGTGWQKGGSLGWRVIDDKGSATSYRGRATGVPTWDFTAAYAEEDDFVVLY